MPDVPARRDFPGGIVCRPEADVRYCAYGPGSDGFGLSPDEVPRGNTKARFLNFRGIMCGNG